ncbi:MAG: HEPN domain-containing protein [Bacteroidales bacterium]|nr:MAG: HEPN domain-containing protein [Bacteroidales bacterium]
MNLNESEKGEFIRYRLQEAKDTIEDVKLLIDNDRLRASVNRIYYGMFYSLLALGIAYDYETSKHQQLIGWFNKIFIHEGLIDSRFGRIINKASNRRTKGDYESFVEFEKEIVIEMFEEMKEFISEIDRYLNSKSRVGKGESHP